MPVIVNIFMDLLWVEFGSLLMVQKSR